MMQSAQKIANVGAKAMNLPEGGKSYLMQDLDMMLVSKQAIGTVDGSYMEADFAVSNVEFACSGSHLALLSRIWNSHSRTEGRGVLQSADPTNPEDTSQVPVEAASESAVVLRCEPGVVLFAASAVGLGWLGWLFHFTVFNSR